MLHYSRSLVRPNTRFQLPRSQHLDAHEILAKLSRLERCLVGYAPALPLVQKLHSSYLAMSAQNYSLASFEESSNRGEHECKHLKNTSSVRSSAKAWWYFPAHLLWSVAVSAIVLGPLNHHAFPVHKTASFALTQSDVSTLISIGLKVTSIICSTLQGILAWRCAFIALNRKGRTFLNFRIK